MRYKSELAIYEREYQKRDNFLHQPEASIREDIKFISELDQESKQQIEVLTWHFQEHDFKNGLYFSNELARKFLI
jgi:5'-3' exonuclease